MDTSLGAGFMAVFAVSGSVALLAFQVHKRLLSDFMKKIEFELGSRKYRMKKKVRFAEEVVELPPENGGYHRSHPQKRAVMGVPSQVADHKLDTMPMNWQVLYKGIIEYRALRGHI